MANPKDAGNPVRLINPFWKIVGVSWVSGGQPIGAMADPPGSPRPQYLVYQPSFILDNGDWVFSDIPETTDDYNTFLAGYNDYVNRFAQFMAGSIDLSGFPIDNSLKPVSFRSATGVAGLNALGHQLTIAKDNPGFNYESPSFRVFYQSIIVGDTPIGILSPHELIFPPNSAVSDPVVGTESFHYALGARNGGH